jgi:type II protein arginine methyltransferase
MSTTSLDALIARAAENPIALLSLARTLLAKGDGEKAHALATQARAAAPDDPQVRALAAEVLSHSVPPWHFSIVRDEIRNNAYEAALKRAIAPSTRVLEIGTGSGLLAMMAARAGAARVFSCEVNSAVAQAAQDIVAKNGFADRVTVLAKHSSDLDAEKDLGGKVDLLVSEIVSNNIVGEGALPAHEQALRRLVKPGGQIIPLRGRVHVALGEDRKWSGMRLDHVAGFDLTAFNRLAAPVYQFPVGDERLIFKSDDAVLFAFDFSTGGPYPETRADVAVAAQAGTTNGIVQWISLDLDETGRYQNRPAKGTSSNWAALFYPFDRPVTFQAGQRVTIAGAHDRLKVRIWMPG